MSETLQSLNNYTNGSHHIFNILCIGLRFHKDWTVLKGFLWNFYNFVFIIKRFLLDALLLHLLPLQWLLRWFWDLGCVSHIIWFLSIYSNTHKTIQFALGALFLIEMFHRRIKVICQSNCALIFSDSSLCDEKWRYIMPRQMPPKALKQSHLVAIYL